MVAKNDNPIGGKTVRWHYDDGPTKGQAFEHAFGKNGKVAWTMLDAPTSGRGGEEESTASYEATAINPSVWLVAYRAPSGWTLTSVLDLRRASVVSVASNETQLMVQHGAFQFVGEPRATRHVGRRRLRHRSAPTRKTAGAQSSAARPRRPSTKPTRASVVRRKPAAKRSSPSGNRAIRSTGRSSASGKVMAPAPKVRVR